LQRNGKETVRYLEKEKTYLGEFKASSDKVSIPTESQEAK
jgi:hypothetical protein